MEKKAAVVRETSLPDSVKQTLYAAVKVTDCLTQLRTSKCRISGNQVTLGF